MSAAGAVDCDAVVTGPQARAFQGHRSRQRFSDLWLVHEPDSADRRAVRPDAIGSQGAADGRGLDGDFRDDPTPAREYILFAYLLTLTGSLQAAKLIFVEYSTLNCSEYRRHNKEVTMQTL